MTTISHRIGEKVQAPALVGALGNATASWSQAPVCGRRGGAPEAVLTVEAADLP